jgi:hypothetical protein
MRFDPISTIAYKGVREWLRMEKSRKYDQPSPSVNLLLRGLPQGCIRDITEDFGIVLIDTQYPSGTKDRSARYFDPAGIALVRLLLFGGGSIRVNRTKVGTDDQKDYLVLSGHSKVRDDSSERYLSEESESRIGHEDVDLNKVPVRRIVGNTPPGIETFSRDHRSYRRGDLYMRELDSNEYVKDIGISPKSPRTSRSDAVDIAVGHLLSNPRKSDFPMGHQGLRTIIQTAFVLLDRIPLARSPEIQK